MQAVIGGGARHHVEGALVGFVAGIEHVARLGGTGGLHAFSGPVFGPRKTSVAIYVGIKGVNGVLKVSNLLGCLRFAQIFLSQKVLGFLGLGLDRRLLPRFSGVVVFI